MTAILLNSLQVVSCGTHLTDGSGREVENKVAILTDSVVHADDVSLGIVLMKGVHDMTHNVFLGNGTIDIGDDNLGVVVEKIARNEESKGIRKNDQDHIVSNLL